MIRAAHLGFVSCFAFVCSIVVLGADAPPVQSRPATQTRPAAKTPPATQPAPKAQPRRAAIESKVVTFPTKDNLLIAGTYTPPPRKAGKAPMVILLHMYNSDHTAYEPLVPTLHTAGFAVLAIDLRGHGDSVGPPEMGLTERVAQRDKKLFDDMDRDVEAAYAWLAKQSDVDPARFVLVGASVGCSVALDYAARDRSVDGIACLTPGTAYLGLDSLADARKCDQRRLLLLAAEEERAACDELKRTVPTAIVQVIGSAGADRMSLHGTRMLGKVDGIEKTISEFLAEAAGPPPEEAVIASIQGEVYHQADAGSSRQISLENIRWFSSPQEAEARGLRPPKSRSSSRTRTRGASSGGETFPGSDGVGQK